MSIISCTSPRPSCAIFPTSSVTSAPSASFSPPELLAEQPDELAAARRRHVAPRLERDDRARDRGSRVGLARARHAGDLLARDRRADDEVALGDERRVDPEALEQVRRGRACRGRGHPVSLGAGPRPLHGRELAGRAARLVEARVPLRVGGSTSPMSWPRSAIRTGWAASGVTRYWYQVMSHAKVSTVSALTPASGTIETFGSPRLLATPGDRAAEVGLVEEVGGLDERRARRRRGGAGSARRRPARPPPRARRGAPARASSDGAGADAAGAPATRRAPRAPSRGRARPRCRAGRRRRTRGRPARSGACARPSGASARRSRRYA